MSEETAKKAQSKILSVDEMLACEDTQYAEIEAWGGKVRIGSLTAEEMIEFVESNENAEAKRLAGLRMIVRSLVNEKNERIGTEAHVKAFAKKDAAVTSKIVGEILKLNGLDKKAAVEAKND